MSVEAVGPEDFAAAAVNLAQWKCVLTELEDNLEIFSGAASISYQARELALGWQPPFDLGPLPAELLSRARLLAKAQHRTYMQLRAESRHNRLEAELIRSVPSPSAAAVYLDVAG